MKHERSLSCMSKVYDWLACKVVRMLPFLRMTLLFSLDVTLMKSRLRWLELVTQNSLPHERKGMACSNTWS